MTPCSRSMRARDLRSSNALGYFLTDTTFGLHIFIRTGQFPPQAFKLTFIYKLNMTTKVAVSQNGQANAKNVGAPNQT
jgi:hypothetical protein